MLIKEEKMEKNSNLFCLVSPIEENACAEKYEHFSSYESLTGNLFEEAEETETCEASDAESIGSYTVISAPKTLSSNLRFFEGCENREGDIFDILTIKETETNSRKIKRILDYEIKPLIDKEIPGFVKTMDAGYDENHHFYYVVYEHFGEHTLEESAEKTDITYAVNIALGLDWFKKKKNSEKFIISPKYIKVDDDGCAKVLFAKPFDIFADENLLDQTYLSAGAKRYLSDRSCRINFQDDIYSLIKTFENFIRENYPTEEYKETVDLIMSGSLNEERIKRFSKYADLINLLKKLPSLNNHSKPALKNNRLSELSRTQKNELEIWKKLPLSEKRYIEENAFIVKYFNVEESDSGELIFFLKNNDNINWGKIKELKNEQTKVFLLEDKPPMPLIGEIFDYCPEDGTITIKDPKLNIEEIPKEWTITEDTNQKTSQFKKQIEACQQFQDHDVVNKQLCDIVNTPDSEITCRTHPADHADILDNLSNPKLKNDDSQLEAVVDAINYKPIYLIQGPPGTGKTTVILEIILQLVRQDKNVRILLTSQSNLAVDNVLEKLAGEKDVTFMRLASDNALDKDNVSVQMKQHCFEKKLKKYINDTAKKSSENFSKEFADRDKSEKLLEIHKDWLAFIGNGLLKNKVLLDNGSEKIDLLSAMLKNTNVVGATCIHIASSKYRKMRFEFDYVIMDESSKATPAESLVPLSMGKNIIMIGDDRQLPPVITREEAVIRHVRKKMEDDGLDIDKTYGVSLFEKIKKGFLGTPNERFVRMLDIQYRMPRQIGSLISEFFYDGKLKNPDIPGFDNDKSHGLNLKKPTSIVFLSTSQRHLPYDNGNKFFRQNPCNVEAIKELLEKLNSLYPSNTKREKPLTIGIIAAYKGQVELLKQKINLKKYRNFVTETGIPLIEIKTVDKFQGAERDIIIYDIVRSARGQDNIGFLADYRRINVAFSRAKRLLFVVGDSDYLLNRATFTPSEDFPEFKLQKIAEKLQKEGLIFNSLEEVFNG